MGRASRLCRGIQWDCFTLLLMDNAGIKRVNRALFGRHEVTDVISQRYDPMPGLEGRHGGEVFVNVQRAAERAASLRSKARGRSGKPRAWDESRELALYIAHGCNHLTGAEDAEAAGRSRMRRRELRWLKQAGALGLTRELIRQA